MTAERAELLDVLRIGHETSMRGAGLSICEALGRARYRERRPGFEAEDLLPLLEADPELSKAWFAYSEDKRTSEGWYLLRSGEIGRLDDPDSRCQFACPEDAVAEYVVRELDYWTGL